MAISYKEFDQQSGTIVAGLKQAILSSSDWVHLQLTTGTQNTALSSGASAGATSISTAATIPSGSYIVIGNGVANPEVRLTTAVSGAGPFTVSWSSTEPLANSYSNGAAVGVGSYVKATTTRGAQMVIDLAGTAPDTQAVKPIMYVTHDGTTGIAPIQRYVYFKRFSGATTNWLHVRVSTHKDGLYFDVEGPRARDTGEDSGGLGSYRSCLYIGDIYPYDTGDTTPAVVMIGGLTQGVGDTTGHVRVSKNRDGDQYWLPANLRTLAFPQWSSTNSLGAFQAIAQNGDFVEAPWVVFEQADGMRGRLQYLHYGGLHGTNPADALEPTPMPAGSEMIYGSFKYRALKPFRTDTGSSQHYGFGAVSNSGGSYFEVSALLWVPVAAYP